MIVLWDQEWLRHVLSTSLASLSKDAGKEGTPNADLGNSSKKGLWSQETIGLPAEMVKAAVKVGLIAAAMKAKLFAEHEGREIQRLSANIINHQDDVRLCSDCFHEGGFVPGHSSLDFVKENLIKDYADVDLESWNDQETLMLLEGAQEMLGRSQNHSVCFILFVYVWKVLHWIIIYDVLRAHLDHQAAPRMKNQIRVQMVCAIRAHLDHQAALRMKNQIRVQMDSCQRLTTWIAGFRSEIQTIQRCACSMKAKLFAEHEEREIQRLSANIINHQLGFQTRVTEFDSTEIFRDISGGNDDICLANPFKYVM